MGSSIQCMKKQMQLTVYPLICDNKVCYVLISIDSCQTGRQMRSSSIYSSWETLDIPYTLPESIRWEWKEWKIRNKTSPFEFFKNSWQVAQSAQFLWNENSKWRLLPSPGAPHQHQHQHPHPPCPTRLNMATFRFCQLPTNYHTIV